MGRHHNNPTFKYTLIVCIISGLLFGQMFKLYVHLEHNGMPSSAIIDVHIAFALQDVIYDTPHQEGVAGHSHFTKIDPSSSSFVKKVKLLTPFNILFFIISIVLSVSLLRRICGWYVLKTTFSSLDYLLYPPPRAPPV